VSPLAVGGQGGLEILNLSGGELAEVSNNPMGGYTIGAAIALDQLSVAVGFSIAGSRGEAQVHWQYLPYCNRSVNTYQHTKDIA
jgi:hypothetical protein